MSNIIDSIQLSGTVYTIQGSGGGSGNPTVEVTQAEYDALVSAGTVSANTYYIITDASEVNPNDYVKKADNVVSGYSTYKLFSGITSGYPSKLTDEVLYRKYSFSNNTDTCNFYFKADESASEYGYFAAVGLNWQSKSADTYDYQVSVEWSDSLDGFLIKSTNTSYPYFGTFANSNNYRDSGRLYYKDGEIQSGQTAAYLNSIHKGVDANYVVGFPNSTSISNDGYINIRLLTESGDISTSIKIANTDDFNWDNNGISYKKVEGEFYYDTLAMTTYGSCRIPSSEKTSYPDAYTGIKLKINPSYNTDNTDRSISIHLGGTTNKTNTYWNTNTSKTIYYNASTDSIDTNNLVGTYGIESITYDQTSHYITILMDVSNTYNGYYWAIKQIGHGSCWIGTTYQIIEVQAQTNKYKPFDYLNDIKIDKSAITSSVTSASTDSEIPTAKAVYDAIPQGGGGGSITIDPSLDSGSTNPVANSAITNAINGRQLKREYVGSDEVFASSDTVYGRTIYHPMFRCYSNNSTNTELVLNNKDLGLYFPTVNGKKIFSTSKYETDWLGDVIEASAITTSITSSSTDSQIPSAKAVNDKLGGLSIVKLTQSEYDNLATKDNSTLYVIVN